MNKRVITLFFTTALSLSAMTGCEFLDDFAENSADNYVYVNGSVDNEFFYKLDKDRDKITLSDISAALVASVLSGVFEDNYIDVSTIKVTDISSGFSMYSGSIQNDPPAKIGMIIEASAISKEDYNNEKYKTYNLTEAIQLSITYGNYWGNDHTIGDYSYINLSDYNGGFDGFKEGIDEGAKYGWYNIFATADKLDKDKITQQFQTIYQNYNTSDHQSSGNQSNENNV